MTLTMIPLQMLTLLGTGTVQQQQQQQTK